MNYTVQVALDHRELPFNLIVEKLVPERNLSYPPLCQVNFVLQNIGSGDLELPGLQVNWRHREGAAARFDLTLFAFETTDAVKLTWRYNIDLFRAETIESMGRHFNTLLEAIVATPNKTVGTLPLLSSLEQEQFLSSPVATSVGSRSASLIELFESQVEQNPEKILLVGENLQQSCRESISAHNLNCLANRLARYLCSQGVISGTRIGVYLPRSVDAVIAALAIFKVAGTYVPLDANYPQQRLQYMMKQANITVLISSQNLLQTFSPSPNTVVVSLDGKDTDALSRESTENLGLVVPEESIAYVMFTSGSTGQPKGVMASYANVTNYMNVLPGALGINAGDVYLHAASFSFSSSIRQFGVPLVQGARVVIASTQELLQPRLLLETIAAQNVTAIDLVPSHWSGCMDVIEQCAPETQNMLLNNQVRLVLAASDTLIFDIPYRWRFDLGHPAEIINMYGQTETTGIITLYRMTDTHPIAGHQNKPVPVGYPVANTQVYVLNKNLQPLPPGVPGDLYTSGASVCVGYLNQPDLNAQRFFQHPITGQRLYYAGDRARYLPDGNLDFLGRHDFLIKLRGFRIELGEIEAALLSHPHIYKAVVLVQEVQETLVAYITLVDTDASAQTLSSFSVRELRNYLSERLPQYMIPAEFMVLSTIPTNVNRKVDRKALPDLDLQEIPNLLPPCDALECQLAAIWQEVLDLRSASVRTSFFEAGGHSLLAVRLMTRIQKELDQQIPLAVIFECQTIESLAQWLRHHASCHTLQPSSLLVPIQLKGTAPPFFCIPGVGGNTSYLYYLSNRLGTKRPFYGLQSAGLDEGSIPHRSIEAAAADYLAIMKTVQPEGPYYLGGHSFGGKVAFEISQQLCRQGQQVAMLAIFDSIPYKDSPIRPDTILEDNDRGYSDLNENEDLDNISLYLNATAEFTGLDSTLSRDQLAVLNPEERFLKIKEQLERVHFLPSDSSLAEAKKALEVVLCSFHSSKIYRPQATHPMPIPIVLFSPESLATSNREHQAKRWAEVGPTTVHVVPGTHASMLAEPHVAVLARLLNCAFEDYTQ